MPTLTPTRIAALAGLEPPPPSISGAPPITRVSAISEATPNTLVFAQDEPSLTAAIASAAGLILAPASLASTHPDAHPDPRILPVASPKYTFALCARHLAQEAPAGIHPTASVDPTATHGQRLRVGALAIIEADVILGDDVTIGAGAKILRGTRIGSRVVIQPGAVLGSTGFGYVRHPSTGEYILFPQQGTLVLEDDVEIGANTTIDRGALGETRIGQGTKIDNLVQIGHNCRIGRNVIIASQVGISGSTTIEDGVIMAGQVGLGDHVTIGPNVILGGQSGVYPGKTLTGPHELFAGTPAEPVRDFLKSLARLRRLK
jgi:UDP-3-O-[3-hydroxymyristoyl] glucosamine N-acyltransferase